MTPDNYPSTTPDQLRIADLERENDAALKEIWRLSQMIVDLGYDPSVKKDPGGITAPPDESLPKG